MQTQEETSPPSSSNLIDDLNQRVRELLAQAQSQFRATGLEYSEKLHQYFVNLSNETASEPGQEDVETNATPAAH